MDSLQALQALHDRHFKTAALSAEGDTILQQLGGTYRLKAMLGVYYIAPVPHGLEFAFPSRKVNHVKITLNPRDLYDIVFYKSNVIRSGRDPIVPVSPKVVKQVDDIDYENLIGVIEDATGFYLSLGGRRASKSAKFEEGVSVDVPAYFREKGNPQAAKDWEAMNEEHGDSFKESSAEETPFDDLFI